METLDHHILALLAADGRMSYTDIGKATGLSTSAAQQRVRRLEQRGVITSYRAVLSPEQLGRTLTAFIAIRPFDPAEDELVPPAIAAMPEVIDCYSVAGEASYLLKVQVATTTELDELLTRMRLNAKVSTSTTVALTTLFTDRPLLEPAGHGSTGADEA
ncbi:Lrp/AsnC family transcriptional regulator [Aestuariimicrobium soli]|uniref:Lrp/AsnC family transcriptional regulator n=1 Tax=Aestuariimicrobium soli TaxID=2035834 RepID=UPI003EBB2723